MEFDLFGLFLNIGWMVQNIKCLISTAVTGYGTSHIECSSSGFVPDALGPNSI